MSNRPVATVVIPTRDRSEFLLEAVGSALAQEGVDTEIVVSDDGSTDGTVEALSELADPRVRVIRRGASQGQARARNEGIQAARGEWVAFLDDDDLWSPTKLRCQLETLAAERARWAFSAVLLLDGDRTVLRRLPVPDPAAIGRLLLRDNVLPAGTSNVVVETRLLRELGGFDERLEYLTDWDLWIRLAQVDRPAACRRPHVGYLVHGGNLHMQDPARALPEIDLLMVKHASISRNQRVEFGSVASVRWRAAQSRIEGRRLPAARLYAASALRERRIDMLARALAMLLGEGFLRGMRRALGKLTRATPAWLDAHH